VKWTDGATTVTRGVGRLVSITPAPGQYQQRETLVEFVDWLDDAAITTISGVETQLSKRADEILTALLAGASTVPEATSFDAGDSTFTYALDNLQDERTRLLSAFSTLAQSEGGFIYLVGDGTLTFKKRTARASIVTSEATFNETMQGLSVRRSREDVINRVLVTIHPRRIDAAATTVLWSLNVENNTAEVLPGQTVTFMGQYGDPLDGNARCGGTDMVNPVATTDYTMNAQADGGGADLTADFSVTPSALTSSTGVGANGVRWSVTNNGAVTGYITLLRIRGKGIYDTTPVVSTAEDAASIASYGERLVQVDMPYQDDPAVGAGFAAFLLNLYSTPTARPTSVHLRCSSDTLLNLALAWDIGTRFTIQETQTGADTDVFIQRVGLKDSDGLLTVTWGLAPADMNAYWLIGITNASELGLTTRFGFA